MRRFNKDFKSLVILNFNLGRSESTVFFSHVASFVSDTIRSYNHLHATLKSQSMTLSHQRHVEISCLISFPIFLNFPLQFLVVA
ncbi:hypothetical protein MKW98_008070 [Papaver atlanticum]|uniref:Uncharacterized protein n=1 Tax=Papaver atlanticum TaxID=357466 RepID=A0AAD4S8M3_9MAGN|nr:hypothetical protein MKW98_008070 [Papaver atlanticum]